jgi:hypothetical protein
MIQKGAFNDHPKGFLNNPNRSFHKQTPPFWIFKNTFLRLFKTPFWMIENPPISEISH